MANYTLTVTEYNTFVQPQSHFVAEKLGYLLVNYINDVMCIENNIIYIAT